MWEVIKTHRENSTGIGTNTTAVHVLVITPLRGMLLVYRPDTRGRVAPEGGGSINRNIPTRGVIISL